MMRFHSALVFIAIATSSARRISKTSCSREAAFYRIASDHILDEEPISKNVTEDLAECIDFCVETEDCVAMNTHTSNDSKLDCHLLRDDHMSKSKKVIPKKGWNLYDTGSKDISRTVGSRCASFNTNPCPSHCTCIDTCTSYECYCYGPEIYSSCREALKENPGVSRYFWIRREGLKSAVYAKCVKGTDGSYRAFVDHDLEKKQYVSGYTTRASYQKTFTYALNKLEDVIEFVNASSSCRQYTKLECNAMPLFNGDWGYLSDRNGKKMSYFGGGPSDGTGCACGITGTCRSNAYKCNCDANSGGVLVTDEGYVTDKMALPITKINLGHSVGGYGYHTLGSLECTESFPSCREALKDYPDGGLYHWIRPAGMSRPVYVKCIKSTYIWTQFDHDSEAKTYVSGYENCYSYKRNFKYAKNDIDNIISFISLQDDCRQKTRFDCRGMHFISRKCAALYGPNGKKLSYFGGGPPTGSGCACGLKGTCLSPYYQCNCDANTDTVTFDTGYINKDSDLPLTSISIGDTGSSSEYGYHTIGKLECRDSTYTCDNALRKFPNREFHWIQRSGQSEAVYVRCVRYADGKAWAQLDHTSEAKGFVNGSVACNAFKKRISYGVNTAASIASFIDTSASCRQHTRLDCRGSKFVSRNCGHLKGRSGKQLRYFGGGPSNGNGCDCGRNRSCVNASYTCNCDSDSDAAMTHDEGYVTKSEDLPLTEISLGGLANVNEYIHFTIGKLECTAIYSSCTEALFLHPSKYQYLVQYEGMTRPVRVQCTKTGGAVWANFKHDSEGKTYVKGFEAALSYRKDITYNDNVTTIVSFINASASCRQFVRIDCNGMAVVYDGSQLLIAVLGRDGAQLNYMPGGAIGSRGCACGITGTCANPSYKCNCDTNDNVLRFDEGYITTKNHLPLTGILMGDTGHSTEYGFHTIGRLQCTETFSSCQDALSLYPSGTQRHFSIKKGAMSAAVYVKCEKKSDGKVWAYFHHDTEEKIFVSGFESRFSYKRQIKYTMNNNVDIAAFIDASTSCRQFTRFDCAASILIDGRLLGRSGKILAYYGGGPADGAGCACGITNSCKAASTKCNCDSNTSSLSTDEGYITTKGDLPLTEVNLGDTGGSDEYAYHTIGRLECQE